MKYLLDTNACVRFLRGGPSTDIGLQLAQLSSADDVVTCSVVRENLCSGAAKSRYETKPKQD